ncbi:hypothetical protein KXX49_001402 [Aspergillus fumigatus]|nr:hypothetical protein KXX49_001402 [Aspergillus fumigatus]
MSDLSHPVILFPLRLNDRDSDRDRDRKPSSSSSTSSRPKQRHHRSSHGRPSRASTKDRDRDIPTGHSSTTSLSTSISASRQQRRFSMPGVDAASRSATASLLESRTSLPYPTFSKAHSREAVGKPSIPTPDPTDLTENKESGDADNKHRTDSRHAPPSPPLTSLDQGTSGKGSTVGDKEEKAAEEKNAKPKDMKTKIRIRAESTKSSSSLRSKRDETSKSSKTARPETPKPNKDKDTPTRVASKKSSKAKIADEDKLPKRSSSRGTLSPPRSPATVREVGSGSANGSDATIAPHQPSITSRKPQTPPVKPPSRNQTRVTFVQTRERSTFGAPPPPPPPPEVPVSIPRVDYLLQNGGLDHRVPKTLLPGPEHPDSPQQQLQPAIAAAKVFDPFNRLLDDYQHVMAKNGSLAVATGYRSVARRLLDRLEAVFARDISSESCHCLMCDHDEMEERPSGVSWGEVLELVSGRRELPSWPPFMMAPSVEADLSGDEHIPMQKMDIDVPEEYRDHYLRQSRKTKAAVDKWLNEQVAQPTSAPEEVDDETLTFAMLTHLGPELRPLFCSLLGITSTSTPTPRTDDQLPRAKPQALVSSSIAIQRLYRLSTLPRDPETAIYMLNNPGIHHVLATLAAISDDEWDILISGRFDGFLRSGAEDPIPGIPGATPTRWSSSRSNTPFTTGGMSRGPTPSHVEGGVRPASQPYGVNSPSPASFGGPIALDEETEIAALAEIEREIFLGMEALEDAFEALHCKAEAVRRTLRERGAGLSIANQNRRGSYVEARLGTPSSALGTWESGTEDDGIDDDRSLAPDDSASNISSNRRRRPKRRTERRTPAPVEEEDEEEEESHPSRRDRDRGSRRR